MEGGGTEYLHQGKEKVFGKNRLKIIEAEGREKNKQVREICKKHFLAARGI